MFSSLVQCDIKFSKNNFISSIVLLCLISGGQNTNLTEVEHSRNITTSLEPNQQNAEKTIHNPDEIFHKLYEINRIYAEINETIRKANSSIHNLTRVARSSDMVLYKGLIDVKPPKKPKLLRPKRNFLRLLDLKNYVFEYVTLPSGRRFLISKPKEAESLCVAKGHLLLLSADDERWKYEYGIIKTEIEDKMGLAVTVSRIEKVMNRCLLRRYNLRKKRIVKELNFDNEYMLYTSVLTPRKAAVNGFEDFPIAKKQISKTASPTGMYHRKTGFYFAKNINNFGCVERQRATVCKVMLCRVLLGRMYNTTASYGDFTTTPPLFHSLRTEVLGVTYHIVFQGGQIYPEFVITFNLSKKRQSDRSTNSTDQAFNYFNST